MCGFAGFISQKHSGNPLPLLRQMAQAIAHRGPDDEGFYADGAVGLAFRRLAILDLSPTGHQPMQSEDAQHTIVFNGEIYNFVELRAQLTALGHRFSSSGDTAVLLAAYRQWGAAMLPRLNGMFAFVIHDRERQVVFGARDRFGVKPLFHAQTPDGHFLASEIKALRPATRLDVDETQLATLAASGRTDRMPASRRTFFTNVEEVAPGHAFEVDGSGRFREWKWWDLAEATREASAQADRESRFRELFESAVALRMRSDVPIGVMLSGGLDSTAVICAMARQSRAHGAEGQTIHAFSYQDPAFDERQYIRDTVAQTGARLHGIPPLAGSAVLATLEGMLRVHDEPVHSAPALIGYRIYALAREHGVKVLLGGQGADEVLGGYTSYYTPFLRELLVRGRITRLRREMRAIAAMGYRPPTIPQLLRSSVSNALRHLPAWERRLAGRAAVTMPLWASATAVQQAIGRRLHARPEPFTLNGELRDGLTSFPLPLYLRVEDRNSMAHGVEGRLPFMDYRLVTLAFSLGATSKISEGRTKVLLRDAARDLVPPSVSTRSDKMGFPVDLRTWFASELHDPTQDLLSSASARTRGLYDLAGLRGLLDRTTELTIPEADALFQFLQVETWLRGLEQQAS